MEMKEVEEILKKHNELLDSITEEERIQFYASFGMTIKPSNENKEEKPKSR